MQLVYGNYFHSDSECTVTITRQPKYNEGGMQIGYTEKWAIRGFLQAPNGATLSLAMGILKLAYLTQGQSIGLFFSDGTPTNHQLNSTACIGGTRVTDAVSFPEGGGAEYVQNGQTYRSYTCAVEGDVVSPGTGLLAFAEQLSFVGTGGPKTVWKELLNGLPQKQRVTDASTMKIVQSGNAIGQFAYPPYPGPLWPASELLDQRETSNKSPKRMGPPGKPTYVEFPVSWKYVMQGIGPITGVPNRWRG